MKGPVEVSVEPRISEDKGLIFQVKYSFCLQGLNAAFWKQLCDRTNKKEMWGFKWLYICPHEKGHGNHLTSNIQATILCIYHYHHRPDIAPACANCKRGLAEQRCLRCPTDFDVESPEQNFVSTDKSKQTKVVVTVWRHLGQCDVSETEWKQHRIPKTNKRSWQAMEWTTRGDKGKPGCLREAFEKAPELT